MAMDGDIDYSGYTREEIREALARRGILIFQGRRSSGMHRIRR